jgi:hypothetical protein
MGKRLFYNTITPKNKHESITIPLCLSGRMKKEKETIMATKRIVGLNLLMALILALPAFGMMTEGIYPSHDNYWTGRVMNSNGEFSKHNADLMFGKDPPDDKWQGWVKFDMSDIPDNVVITEASIGYQVISAQGEPHTYVTLVASDPVIAEPEVLWNDITTGTVLTDELVEVQGWVERPLNADGIAALQAGLAQDWLAVGLYKFDESESKGHVKGYEAERFRPVITITFAERDLAIEAIVTPVTDVFSGYEIVPAIIVRNNGEIDGPFMSEFVISDNGNELYRQNLGLSSLLPGNSAVISFPAWLAGSVGERMAEARIDVENDARPEDNYAVAWFNVLKPENPPEPPGEPPPPSNSISWGWQEVRSVPVMPSNRPVLRGGWLASDPVSGLAYASKGNKTAEFYSYNPHNGLWSRLADIPRGLEGRMPGSGAVAVADGNGSVFVLKGSNTVGFWRYDIARNTWEQLPGVPLYPSNKKVNNGGALVYIEQWGLGYVYLLKGPKGDFYRYNIHARTWQVLQQAPTGVKARWPKGSWLVYDGGSKLYAHKAQIHELWVFDLETEQWGTAPLSGMPYFGALGRSKKSKDGGSAFWRDGVIYALKGGRTPEFFQYQPLANSWTELDPMPPAGSSRLKAALGQGGGFVNYPYGNALYALKGNKTVEMWRYIMPPSGTDSNEDPGYYVGLDGRSLGAAGVASAAIGPNPVTGSVARLSYNIPVRNRLSVSVFDASGRLGLRREVEVSGRGSMPLDLRSLRPGVYLARVESDGFEFNQKLVISR